MPRCGTARSFLWIATAGLRILCCLLAFADPRVALPNLPSTPLFPFESETSVPISDDDDNGDWTIEDCTALRVARHRHAIPHVSPFAARAHRLPHAHDAACHTHMRS